MKKYIQKIKDSVNKSLNYGSNRIKAQKAQKTY